MHKLWQVIILLSGFTLWLSACGPAAGTAPLTPPSAQPGTPPLATPSLDVPVVEASPAASPTTSTNRSTAPPPSAPPRSSGGGGSSGPPGARGPVALETGFLDPPASESIHAIP